MFRAKGIERHKSCEFWNNLRATIHWSHTVTLALIPSANWDSASVISDLHWVIGLFQFIFGWIRASLIFLPQKILLQTWIWAREQNVLLVLITFWRYLKRWYTLLTQPKTCPIFLTLHFALKKYQKSVIFCSNNKRNTVFSFPFQRSLFWETTSSCYLPSLNFNKAVFIKILNN